MSDHQDVAILKRELLGLFEYIQKIRKEIASIRRPGHPDKDHFSKMSDELDAIVSATASATDTILETVEEMEDLIEKVRPMVANPEGRALLDTFPDKTGKIFEACAFQDITGQRISKVVASLQFVEERVNALISIWGKNQIASEAPEDNEQPIDEYKRYLNGPQLAGQGVSQADVDAMFGETPAAKPGGDAQAQPSPTVVAESRPGLSRRRRRPRGLTRRPNRFRLRRSHRRRRLPDQHPNRRRLPRPRPSPRPRWTEAVREPFRRTTSTSCSADTRPCRGVARSRLHKPAVKVPLHPEEFLR